MKSFEFLNSVELDRRWRVFGDGGLSERLLGERPGDTEGRRKCNGTAVGDPSKRDRPCCEGEAERLRLLVRLDTDIGSSSSIWTGDRG